MKQNLEKLIKENILSKQFPKEELEDLMSDFIVELKEKLDFRSFRSFYLFLEEPGLGMYTIQRIRLKRRRVYRKTLKKLYDKLIKVKREYKTTKPINKKYLAPLPRKKGARIINQIKKTKPWGSDDKAYEFIGMKTGKSEHTIKSLNNNPHTRTISRETYDKLKEVLEDLKNGGKVPDFYLAVKTEEVKKFIDKIKEERKTTIDNTCKILSVGAKISWWTIKKYYYGSIENAPGEFWAYLKYYQQIYDPRKAFKLNEEVIHPSYGKGKVVGNGGNNKVHLLFDSGKEGFFSEKVSKEYWQKKCAEFRQAQLDFLRNHVRQMSFKD